MIRFAYPNIKQQRYIGCARFAVMEHGTIRNGYDYADPNSGNLSAVKDAANRLAPESFSSKLEVFEIQDDPEADYFGTSMDLAYLLALVQRSRKTIWDAVSSDTDIWCTGSIDLVNGQPFLKGVDKKSFDIKLESFLGDPLARIFLVPSANIEPRHKQFCIDNGITRITLSRAVRRQSIALPHDKMVLEINAGDLRLLIEKLFLSPPKCSPISKTIRRLAYAAIPLAVLAFVAVKHNLPRHVPQQQNVSQTVGPDSAFRKDPPSRTGHSDAQPKETPNTTATSRSKSSEAPQAVKVKGLSKDIATALLLAYEKGFDIAAPTAAVAVLVQQQGNPSTNWQPLMDGASLSSKDNYRILFQPVSSAFFYVFQIDSTGKLDWIFPKNSSSPYSTGNNPVKSGLWTQLPNTTEAFHLDENIGLEHVYVVATAARWEALEKALLDAGNASPVPATEPLTLRTRGIGGTRTMPGNAPKTSADALQHVIQGVDGVMVYEKWFRHLPSQ